MTEKSSGTGQGERTKDIADTPLPPVAPALLRWYHAHRRVLPFREDATPYHVWLSEIMLQQTRVAAVLPYYERFTRELPTIAALAACDEQRLLKLWEGLGYYSRARNLHKAAKLVMQQYGGELPADYHALRALPGIGEYTAGAIASIAFGLPEVAVDGNVLRVFARLLACTGEVDKPATKQLLAAEVRRQQPPASPGDYNQALMELGALVCLPGNPACDACPLAALCRGYAQGVATTLPRKAPKKDKVESQICLLIVKSGDRVLLQKRPESGLLAGLWQPFLLEGSYTKAQAQRELQRYLPQAKLGDALPQASHVFTHRVWRMYGWQARLDAGAAPPEGFVFASAQGLAAEYPLPGAFKVYRAALGTEISHDETGSGVNSRL